MRHISCGVCVCFVLCTAVATVRAAPVEHRDSLTVGDEIVTIDRDLYGVPHIFAATPAGLYEAYGFVVAQDRLWQLELNRRAAAGELAEIFGERFLDVDRYTRSTGYTRDELAAQLHALSAPVAAALRAYTAGINRYLEAVVARDKSTLPYEFTALEIEPRPWTPEDCLAFGTFMLRRFGEIGGDELQNHNLLAQLSGHMRPEEARAAFADLLWRNDPGAPTTIPEAATWRTAPALGVPSDGVAAGPIPDPWLSMRRAKAQWSSLGVPSRLGSYAWVVSSKKSATGSAMLLGGPQMGTSAPEVVHEVQLVAGDLSVAGMAFAGVPFVLIGHSRDLAWTSTTAVGDNLDVYIETLCTPSQGPAVGTRFFDRCVPLSKRRERIAVRGREPVAIDIFRSVHGPALPAPALGLAVAQRRAHWGRETAAFEGFWRFNHAHTLEEFAAGVPHVVTQHNFLYADRAGNIAYWQAGAVPRRPAGFDFRLPLPGDGSAEWLGESLPTPTCINPDQGYLANWNNKPSVGFDSADNRFFGRQSRLTAIARRLEAGPVSYDDLFAIVEDIARVDLDGRDVELLRPYLFAALDAVPPRSQQAAAARRLLATWTGEGFEDAVLARRKQAAFMLWEAVKQEMLAAVFGGTLGDAALGEFAHVNTLLHALDAAHARGHLPMHFDFLGPDKGRRALSRAFDRAVQHLTDARGPDVHAWGEDRGTVSLTHPLLGPVGEVPLSNRATWAQGVQWGKTGIEAKTIFTLGQSGFIGRGPDGAPQLAGHYKDLLPLYVRFGYKPLWLWDHPLPEAPEKAPTTRARGPWRGAP